MSFYDTDYADPQFLSEEADITDYEPVVDREDQAMDEPDAKMDDIDQKDPIGMAKERIRTNSSHK